MLNINIKVHFIIFEIHGFEYSQSTVRLVHATFNPQ